MKTASLILVFALVLSLGAIDVAHAEDSGVQNASDSTDGTLCEGKGEGRKGKKGRRGRGKRRFAKHDANGDGSITADEVSAEVWDRISKADTDGNGAVSKAEAKAAAKARKGKRGKRGKRGGGQGGSTDA